MNRKVTPMSVASQALKRDWNKLNSVQAFDVNTKETVLFEFIYTRKIGLGTFGIVCLISEEPTKSSYALKTVHQSRRHANRECEVMCTLNHPNIIRLHKYFYTELENNETYLNLVLEYLPQPLDEILRMSPGELRGKRLLLGFQFLLALEYLHARCFGHRDLKPHNLLVNLECSILKLCDFGCAKRMAGNTKNVPYICARYYRAPEVLYGSQDYTFQMDMWGAGCLLAELYTGKPLWKGHSTLDQLEKIGAVLGTPTKKEFKDMGCPETSVKNRQTGTLKTVLKTLPEDILDLVLKMLVYSPKSRITAAAACRHKAFRDIYRLCETLGIDRENLVIVLKETDGLRNATLPKDIAECFFTK